MKIARVFPRVTNATPDDDMCFFTPPPLLTMPEIDEVHVAMLYRDQDGKADTDWRRFQRGWLRPALVSHIFGEVWHNADK